MKLLGRILFVGLLSFSFTSTAFAQTSWLDNIPASCNPEQPEGTLFEAPELRSYRAGYRQGEYLVNAAWNRVSNCDEIETFETLVMNSVSRYTLNEGASLSTVCRYSAVITAILDGIDSLYWDCEELCTQDGELAGDISGQAYCELSIALGGLAEADDFIRGPVQICGLAFEIACDQTFEVVTTSYSNDDGECVVYTEGEFEAVWRQAQNNQCAYWPEEMDPKEED